VSISRQAKRLRDREQRHENRVERARGIPATRQRREEAARRLAEMPPPKRRPAPVSPAARALIADALMSLGVPGGKR